MKATSATYVALQHIYVAKARRDLDTFQRHLDGVLRQAGVDRSEVGLDEDQVRTFVKHAAHLRLVRGRRLEQQRADPDVGAMGTFFLSRSAGLCGPREPGHGAVPGRVLWRRHVLCQARPLPRRGARRAARRGQCGAPPRGEAVRRRRPPGAVGGRRGKARGRMPRNVRRSTHTGCAARRPTLRPPPRSWPGSWRRRRSRCSRCSTSHSTIPVSMTVCRRRSAASDCR